MTAIALDPLTLLPNEMRTAPRWLVWKSIPQEGKKPRKVPFYADGAARSGKLDTQEDWARLATLDDAVSALSRGGYAGLGFALGPDGSGQVWQGVDLDGLGERPELGEVAGRLPGFVEASPSGNGLHAIGYGRPFQALGSNISGIEAYCGGRYFTVTGNLVNEGPITDIADFVEVELRPRHGAHKAARSPTSRAPGSLRAVTRPTKAVPEDPLLGASPGLLANLRDALQHLGADDYNEWIANGEALKTLGDAARDLWHEYSSTSRDYDPEEAEAKWRGFEPDRTGYAAIFAKAQRLGWRNPASRAGQQGAGRSEEDLALQFARENEAGLRYCAKWEQWLAWDDVRWAPDTTLLATHHARDLCRRAAAACGNARAALVLGAARTVAAVERLARADRRLAATVDQWDADPWLLNTPGGVVDLKTGELRPCDPALHMTKVTGAAPGGDCPTFLRFLDRITGKDADLQAYLQRVFGYALTGDTSAHALFFGYGTGANGKSVLIDTVAGVLGDYHKTAPIETFTESRGERHPTELAMLRGARLATATETEQGRRWAESRIKTLTGGDRVAARMMRQDFFEFDPQFKLFIAGNHRPGLRSVDEAMRRRFNLIPFAVTIPPEERDAGLKAKLRAEWPGILAWMIVGCVEYQRLGLAPPDAVRAATDAYMEGEDAISAWMDDACERDPQARETNSALFSSWKAWAERHGEFVGQVRSFTQALEARGFQPWRTTQARGRVGLRLKTLDFTL